MAKKISAYETQDGKIFKTLKEAEDYDNNLSFKTQVENLVYEECWSGMDKHDICNFIIVRYNEIIECGACLSSNKNPKDYIDEFISECLSFSHTDSKTSMISLYNRYIAWSSNVGMVSCLSLTPFSEIMTMKFTCSRGNVLGVMIKEFESGTDDCTDTSEIRGVED